MKQIIVTALPTLPIIKNIGDYTQGVATKQFMTHVDGYVDREETNLFESDEKCKAVFNGTFLWKYKNWPPSACIIPLFTSMHIFPTIAEKLMTKENVAYFTKNGPIGCRDIGTLNLMSKYNIPAYHSACLTLTLGKTYKPNCKHNKILFVDPIIPDLITRWHPAHWDKGDIGALLKIFKTLLQHPFAVSKLCKKDFFRMYSNRWGHRETKGIKNTLETVAYVCEFLRIYSSKFEINTLVDSDIISNMYYLKEGENNHESLIRVSEEYIKKYTEYPLVITSRIHCALPCLGIGIPVVFIVHDIMESNDIAFNTPGRFDGIIDFFRVLRVKNEKLVSEDKLLDDIEKINIQTKIINKDNWKPFADKLAKQVSDFFKE